MTEKDYLTDYEKRKKERNNAIIADFKKLNPLLMRSGYRPYRTISQIASKHKMTEAGVRSILKREGVIDKLSNIQL